MKTKKFAIILLMLISALTFITSCASVTRGIMSSTTSYERVFNACLESASDVKFRVYDSNVEAGFIYAVYPVTLGGMVQMNINVTKTAGEIKVAVAVALPPDVVGSSKSAVNDFAKALKRRIPDVKVESIE
jgi:hypothetical protein